MSDDKLAWRHFERLGDMIGEGMHLEPGGGWIEKEYGRLAKRLVPGIAESKRKLKQALNKDIDEQVKKLLVTSRCTKCSGELKQARSGSKVAYCKVCNSRYIAKNVK